MNIAISTTRSRSAAVWRLRKGSVRVRTLAVTVATAACIGALTSSYAAEDGTAAILLPENINPIWEKSGEAFAAELKERLPNATVLKFNANNDTSQQQTQFEAALTKGAEAIVMVAVDSNSAATLVDRAHRDGVPVIAFDHLINNTPNLAGYFSSDSLEQGRVLGKWVAENTKRGDKFVIINGSPTDNNARLYREGFMEFIQPLFDSGERVLAAEEVWVKGWDPQIAQTAIEGLLTKTKNDIDAVVIPWDDGAGVIAAALKRQDLTGKVIVTGGDATAAALNRILLGLQDMTVLRDHVDAAVRSAVAVAGYLKDGEFPADVFTSTYNNGAADIPSALGVPLVIGLGDVADLVDSGAVLGEPVCVDVPAGTGPC